MGVIWIRRAGGFENKSQQHSQIRAHCCCRLGTQSVTTYGELSLPFIYGSPNDDAFYSQVEYSTSF
jgi:hypothetical protein